MRDSHTLNGSHVLNASFQSICRVWPLTLIPCFFKIFLSLQVPEYWDFSLAELEAENYGDSLFSQHYHYSIFGWNLIISYFKNNPRGSFCKISCICSSDRQDFIFNDLAVLKLQSRRWQYIVTSDTQWFYIRRVFFPFFLSFLYRDSWSIKIQNHCQWLLITSWLSRGKCFCQLTYCFIKMVENSSNEDNSGD